ncbi:AtpZ/AtpI family protein [Sulfobacillus acidophilus]|uniref:AtpZ/AtpI family protein n=1 Tax=Sulfobacillus acidophilus TaxID=53633 RepID=A0ABS3AXA3_9FIRM|nr:AtpZ/AtpI family protein [Sulfobacillus acidophilus]
MNDKKQSERAKLYKTYIKTSAVGLEIGISIIVAIVVGFLADDFFDTSPWGLIFGFIVGATAAAKRLYTFSKQYLKDNKDDSKEK